MGEGTCNKKCLLVRGILKRKDGSLVSVPLSLLLCGVVMPSRSSAVLPLSAPSGSGWTCPRNPLLMESSLLGVKHLEVEWMLQNEVQNQLPWSSTSASPTFHLLLAKSHFNVTISLVFELRPVLWNNKKGTGIDLFLHLTPARSFNVWLFNLIWKVSF